MRPPERFPPVVRKAGTLTPCGLIARYPGIARPVAERDHEEAVAIAEAAVRRAGERL